MFAFQTIRWNALYCIIFSNFEYEYLELKNKSLVRLKKLLESWNVQRTSCAKLSCQPNQLAERIEKMTLNLRQTTKDSKNFTRELAVLCAKELLLSSETLGNDKLITLHRKDMGPDFLGTCAGELQSLTKVRNIYYYICK